ncbi:MAG: hypothetical protein M1828_004538 [Chrysothrix sp. TS-e1954]|nr:MAG: hypothetical protein M1828_004538 [Chrysothrix sp. TS-e1954]
MAAPRSALQHLRTSTKTSTFRSTTTPLRTSLRQPLQRRAQSTATAPNSTEATGGRLAQLWNSNVGPKTVHFWAPIMKWGLVLAGVSDFARPASSLSLTQNLALMGTGAIWTRWCFVIRPKNYFLAAVNFFLFCVGTTQVSRVLAYQSAQKNESLGEEVKDAAKEQAGVVKGMVEDPKTAGKAERT